MDQRFAVAGVESTTPLAEAAAALLLAKAEPLFALEISARAGRDMDAVHDMRVASRRLREAMRLLEPLYPTATYREWFRRVRRVTKALGPVRDADVFVDEFSRLSAALGEGGKRAVAFLVGRRLGLREHQLTRMNRQLGELDLVHGRKSFSKVARSIGTAGVGSRSLAEFAHAAVAERAAVVFGAMPDALIEANIAEQHALRIDFKQLRYAVEVFAPVYGEDFDSLHDTLTAFQDALGDLHDLHLFAEQLCDPSLLAEAARAGVSDADIAEVVDVLDARAKQRFDAFSALAAQNSPGELLGRLLLPLARRPVVAAAAAEPAGPEPGPAAAEPAPEPDEPAGEPAPEPDEPAGEPAIVPAPAVVIEPATVVVERGVPQVDPSGRWTSDAAGLAIDPPIVIGAEPWARVAPVVDEPVSSSEEAADGGDAS